MVKEKLLEVITEFSEQTLNALYDTPNGFYTACFQNKSTFIRTADQSGRRKTSVKSDPAPPTGEPNMHGCTFAPRVKSSSNMAPASAGCWNREERRW